MKFKKTALFALIIYLATSSGLTRAQNPAAIRSSAEMSFEQSIADLRSVAPALSNSSITRTEWCHGRGERFLCAYDRNGNLVFWVETFIHHVSIWSNSTYITCGYPALQQLQKEYNSQVADPSFAIIGYELGAADEENGWKFGNDLFVAPDRLSDAGCYSLASLKAPFFLEARRTIAVWNRFKMDCRNAAAGRRFSGCEWELLPRLLDQIHLTYPTEQLAMRGDAIYKAVRASMTYNQLIEELRPIARAWENRVDAGDVTKVRDHLEPDQLPADFTRRQSEALDAIYRTNTFAEIMGDNDGR